MRRRRFDKDTRAALCDTDVRVGVTSARKSMSDCTYVWGADGTQGSKTLDIYVANLRRKLGSARRRLETVRGTGFRRAR